VIIPDLYTVTPAEHRRDERVEIEEEKLGESSIRMII